MCRNDFLPRERSSFIIVSFSSALVLFLILFITSCEESSFVGLEIQPESDRFAVNSFTETEIGTSVWKRDSVLAIGHPLSLLGVVDDPVFGRLSSGFLTQAGILETVDFGSSPEAQSMVLYLRVTDKYGTGAGAQNFSVYELQEKIDYEQRYYSNTDPLDFTDISEKVADYTLEPAAGDTIIAIPITSSDLQDKLLNAPDTVMQSLGSFLGYFNGIYVSAGLESGSGAVYSIDLNHGDSKMSLFYTNTDYPDSTLRYDFVINEGANRINIFSHDYSEADFYDILEQPRTGDTVFYVQGAAGVMGRLDFERLQSWRDSMPVSINSARLYLPLYNGDDAAENFPPPARLACFEKDAEGQLSGITDLALGDEYFGGTYNPEQRHYSANITNWVQAYVGGRKESSIVFVGVRESGTNPNRAVLKSGYHPAGGARLEITYTRH
ncbi:MAG: DUF4270 family protein [Bacteroidales bacterium]